MSPAAGMFIDNLDLSCFALKLFHVPEVPFEFFVALAGCGAHKFIVNKQIYAGLA